jgi:hypothetical protein
MDWRLLDYHSFEMLNRLAQLIVSHGHMTEGWEYLNEATTIRWYRPEYLLTRIALLAGDAQGIHVTALVDHLVGQTHGAFSSGNLFMAEYLMHERHGDEAGTRNCFDRWYRLVEQGRVRQTLSLPLLGCEVDLPHDQAKYAVDIRYPSMDVHDEILENKVRQLVREDRQVELSSLMIEAARRKGAYVEATLIMVYVLRCIQKQQTCMALYLLDEFMPACSSKRKLQLINELCLMCVRLGDYWGYLDCFRRLRQCRLCGQLSPDACLYPYRFAWLRMHRILPGRLSWTHSHTT